MKSVVLLALFGIVAVLVAACGGAAPSTSLSVTTTPDSKFEPNAWTVPANTPITIQLRNSADEEHEWVIMKLGTQASLPFDENDEPNVLWETEVGPNSTKKDSFTVAQPGTYQIVCGLPTHLEKGMVGTLTVN